MENLRRLRGSAVGITLIAVLCSADFSQTEKLAAVDLGQYADIFENEVFDLQDLAEGAEIQRRFFNRITPPGISWVQPMSPPLAPFAEPPWSSSSSHSAGSMERISMWKASPRQQYPFMELFRTVRLRECYQSDHH
ncbi:MAG: hypothetical protein LBN38_00575 [Verrucomicrobiota bacterium]|nr:hypothetical protein [Verrucomicrobiota bacterium]